MSYTESLPKDCVLDRIQAMILQEQMSYNYQSYFPQWGDAEFAEEGNTQLHSSWREKICQWSYNVVDHFDLPREVVAISLNLFDRYLATRANQCTGNMALLASLTTLHMAIKVHSEKNIKVSTLASLSRGQFGFEHIEQMEWRIMNALGWKLHPPTLFAYVSHLLMLFSADVHHTVRKELFEVAIYLAELSVCDSFFVKYPASAISTAAIMNVMEDMTLHKLSQSCRDEFWYNLSRTQGLQPEKIAECRQRLRSMFASSTPPATSSSTMATSQDYYEPCVTHSPTSTMDVPMSETTDALSACGHSMEQDPLRYSPSPPTAHRMVAVPQDHHYTATETSRIGTSPIVSHSHGTRDVRYSYY